MSTAGCLEGEFRPRATICGGILLFRATDAIALIRVAHHRRIRVLGIDTFRLTSDGTEPMYEHCLDLSVGGAFSESDWDTAATFVRRREADDFQFEVVLADEETGRP